jgi:acyl-CoA reductase-like NAD-dependent aldehyde dehydrogenase
VYHSFLEQLTSRVSGLRPGADAGAAYGPMTLPRQTEVVAKHVADAVALGGRAVVGGPDAVAPPYVRPVVLAEVPENSSAVTEETFGPTVTVTPVANLAEAVTLANAGRYGLGSAVFARDRSAAMAAARSLRSGMTSINSALSFAIVPALPFGGVAESGFGRIHGPDGLREFARPKAIARQRMRPLLNLMSFGRTDRDMNRIVLLITLLHGRLYRPRGERRTGRHA